MIIFDRVAKVRGHLLAETTMSIPTNRRIALLGRSEDHKRKLIDILAGVRLPDTGVIIRQARLSFPVGTLPGIDRKLSARHNVEHLASVYGANVRDTVELVRHVLNIGWNFEKKGINSKDNKRLSFLLPLSLPFDCYLFTGNDIHSDHECWEIFNARKRNAGMIIPVQDENFAKENCDASLVFHHGRLIPFESVEEGLAFMAELKKEEAGANTASIQ